MYSNVYHEYIADFLDFQVDKIWYDLLVSEKKTIEGRKAQGKWLQLPDIMNSGCNLNIKCGNEHCLFYIMDIREYDNVESMLINEGLRNVLPGIKTLQEGIDVYNKYYPDYKGKMLAIELNKF